MRIRISPKTPILMTLLFAAFMICISAGTAAAATFTVDTLIDNAGLNSCTAAPDDCSLRGAIAQANTLAGADVIDFSVTGEIVLNASGALPSLQGVITIDGPGANLLTVRRDLSAIRFRIFTVSAGTTASISGLTITGGRLTGAFGSGILNDNATLTLSDCTITGNATTWGGGGIFSTGSLTVNNCIISDNSGTLFGGGITGGSTININNTTVSGNTAQNGGGVNSDGGVMTLTGVTLSGNSAQNGGGAYSNDSTMIINNSTVSGNSVSSIGGGARNNFNATLIIRNSTITGNTATVGAGGVASSSLGTLNVHSSIVANNVGSPNLLGTIVTGDHNLIGIDPKLGPLQFNGGPTKTHRPYGDSPAINAGDNSFGFTTDQRGAGFVRELGASADIGAVEVPAACTSISIEPANNFTVGASPLDLVNADFNEDGSLDIATANSGANTVSILKGNGSGGFVAATNFAVGFSPFGMTTGDFNGDGHADIATVNEAGDNVSVLMGDGAGNLGSPTHYGVGDSPRSVVAGDFNSDGR